jgi:hypothetical protein|tara:strand:+ start:247 stop:636 length:390 start_codon:yes stop_codon:yes gene_type:complete
MLNYASFAPHKIFFFDFSKFCVFLGLTQMPLSTRIKADMKTKGGITYIGVSLGELKKYFTDDAVIHVSKKFLNSYEMIAGVQESPKPISINVNNNTQKTEIKAEPKPEITEPVLEPNPPIELNVNDGDW